CRVNRFHVILNFFFFQAEDGIRDFHVTGVQTCALPIYMVDVRVESVLEEIESTSEFKFFFNTKSVDLDRRVSINVRKMPIKKVMEELFSTDQTTFVLKDHTIILKHNEYASSKEELKKTELPTTVIQQEVSGNVTDASGVPLVGANIVEKGTSNGVTADFDANFTISVSSATAILVVSYLGFDSKEVTADAGSTINIALE